MEKVNENTDLEDIKHIIVPMEENNSEVESDSEDFKNVIPRQDFNSEETDSEDFKCIIPSLEGNDLEEVNSDSEDFRDVLQYENVATMNSLPDKSREIYLKEYASFKAWCENKNARVVTEDVVLTYFYEKAKVLKSSSLWAKYSMLKITLAVKDNVDIKFPKLLAFLKRQSKGYKARKSETFTRDDINKFLMEAPDKKYLMTKVALVLGVAGGCRCEELTRMRLDDIQDTGSILIVKVPDSTTRIHRTFVVDGETNSGLKFADIYRKYVALRSPKTEHRRLFVNYQEGKCTVQVVGKNKFSKIPSTIAKFLHKPNVDAYTGHCLRRTSASLLVEAGGHVLSLKRRTRWRSPTVVDDTVDDCIESKRQATNSIVQDQELNKDKTNETAAGPSENDEDPLISDNTVNNMSFSFKSLSDGGGITIYNAKNCTFTININK